MYTLVFKFMWEHIGVFDVYHTNEQGQQRIVGNIYCYCRSEYPKGLFHTKTEVKDDVKCKDMLDFQTVDSSKDYKITQEIKIELYNRAKIIFEEMFRLR